MTEFECLIVVCTHPSSSHFQKLCLMDVPYPTVMVIYRKIVAVHRGVMMADTLSLNAKIGVVDF